MLLQALYDFYRRACRDGLIESSAFVQKHVRWTIPLTAEGELEGPGLIENPEPKKGGRLFSVPRTSRPKVQGGVAEFLCDGLEAVFGLSPDPAQIEPNEKKRRQQEANLRAKHANFWQLIEDASVKTQHPAFEAMLKFRSSCSSPPTFLRWGVGAGGTEGNTENWWVKTAEGGETRLRADNFTFRVEGSHLLDEEEAVRPYWLKAYAGEQASKEESSDYSGVCLVTGKADVPISDLHLPKIKRVPGATVMERTLVSFDKEAFTSYGLDKSYNAPVSVAAVEAYCNALNFLLADKRHSLRVGNTVLCFWARESDEATDVIADFFDAPQPEEVRKFMRAPLRGDGGHATPEEDQFYSVALAGNSGRVVMRHWMQTTVGQAVENFRRWFADLNVVAQYPPRDEKFPPLAIKQLARATVRAASGGKGPKDDDVGAEAATQLYRAALEGTAPSLMLARDVLEHFRSDLAKNGLAALNNLSRFALLKLVINRNKKESEPMIEPVITETDDAAYNCGRLLAVFDKLQRAALSSDGNKFEGAGVVDRYYGAASSAPNSAFGVLWRLHQSHLKKLSQSDKGRAAAERIRQQIEEIASRFVPDAGARNQPPQFPRVFDLRAQGRFALGFYQQKAADRAARTAYLDARNKAGQTDTTNTDTEGATDNA